MLRVCRCVFVFNSVLVHELRVVVLCVFFFQAEDGIRDLVRSRGLGDVYKRQATGSAWCSSARWALSGACGCWRPARSEHQVRQEPVSYTHLTLPTSDLV